MVIACVCAKPKPDVLVGAPVVAATPLATSSVSFSREFHAPYVAAAPAYPYLTAYSSPYVAAAPYSAYASSILL